VSGSEDKCRVVSSSARREGDVLEDTDAMATVAVKDLAAARKSLVNG
jgi:hypothetical protein